jgi:3-oxoacyl-[acyl-carrier protein] reductase
MSPTEYLYSSPTDRRGDEHEAADVVCWNAMSTSRGGSSPTSRATAARGRLAGRVALITGASRGIGAAVAAAFAREGAAVAVNYLPRADMRHLAEQVTKQIVADGGNAISVGADVSDAARVADMVATVSDALGLPDVLVLNAAATGRAAWTDIDLDSWDHVTAVNLRGAFLCARAVYPGMRTKGYGKIITVSSVMVELGLPGALHYVASKAGIIGFTRALAREVGPDGIRVNCVMPGAIRTEHEIEAFPDEEERLRDAAATRQSVPRRGVPADMVGAFTYLASSDSDFVTGQVINVDGGWAHY